MADMRLIAFIVPRFCRLTHCSRLYFLVLTMLAWSVASASNDLVIIGADENVTLMPLGVLLPARIDTGATESSLAVRDLTVRFKVAEFRLPAQFDQTLFRARVVKWVKVHSSVGIERRPVVELDLCLGSRMLRTPFNLDGRQGMQFPVLIGRNVLQGRFLVDVQQSHTQQPHCSKDSP